MKNITLPEKDEWSDELEKFAFNLKSTLNHFRKLFLSLFLLLISGIMSFPLLFIINNSLKDSQGYYQDPVSLVTEPQLQNFVDAWTLGGFQQYMLNSAFVVSASLILLFIVTTLATYALVQFSIPGENMILLLIIAGFMIPPEVLVVPLFSIIDFLGWINYYHSVILVYVAFSIPFSVFLLRQFFNTIPDSYAEAARTDGCSELQILFYIYLPLSIPALTTILVYQFVLLWNEFLYAILFLPRDDMRTAPAGVMALRGGYYQEPSVLVAGILIAAIPTILVFLVFRNYFIKGFVSGRI